MELTTAMERVITRFLHDPSIRTGYLRYSSDGSIEGISPLMNATYSVNMAAQLLGIPSRLHKRSALPVDEWWFGDAYVGDKWFQIAGPLTVLAWRAAQK